MNTLSNSQTTQILAALRHWQNTVGELPEELAIDFMPYPDSKPLSIDEIDVLCEELNCSEILLSDKAEAAD